jgi:hypothetical protein
MLSGLLRGLPSPNRETRIFSSTGMNWVQSARCPGVMIRDSGRQRPSALRWILLVKPPRERPRPSLPHHLHQPADEALPRSFVLVFQRPVPLGAGKNRWWIDAGAGRVLVRAHDGGVPEMSQSIAPAPSAAAWTCRSSRSQVPSADQSRWRS